MKLVRSKLSVDGIVIRLFKVEDSYRAKAEIESVGEITLAISGDSADAMEKADTRLRNWKHAGDAGIDSKMAFYQKRARYYENVKGYNAFDAEICAEHETDHAYEDDEFRPLDLTW